MKILHKKLVALFLFAMPVFAYSLNQCQIASCDCKSPEGWQELCFQHKNFLLKNCADQNDAEACSVAISASHEDALRLDLRSNVNVIVDHVVIREVSKRITQTHWDILSGKKNVLQNSMFKNYLQAKADLVTIEASLDDLLTYQRQVVRAWSEKGKVKKVQSALKSYSESNLALAEQFMALSDHVADGLVENQTGYNLYDIVATSLKLSGYAYEMAGYSYGQLNKNNHAAKAWNNAALAGKALIQLSERSYRNEKELKHVRLQTAVRLKRASFYWQLAEKTEDAKLAMEESSYFYVNRNAPVYETLVSE